MFAFFPFSLDLYNIYDTVTHAGLDRLFLVINFVNYIYSNFFYLDICIILL